MNNALIDSRHHHYILARSSAPTLMRLKPSSLICLPKGLNFDNVRLKESGLEMMLMYKGNNGEVILIFNLEMLQNTLDNQKIKDFLATYSYTTHNDIYFHLEHLKKRFQGYFEGKNEFAHEIGLFLGYPFDDVLDFIKKDKRCYFCGYWKVFNNPQEALKIMDAYDLAKTEIINECLKGKEYFEITYNY
jgi:hypothetical protein